MYTSGRTGLPKGVMMTHGNVLATVSAVMTTVPGLGVKDVYLAYLLLAHILELSAEACFILGTWSLLLEFFDGQLFLSSFLVLIWFPFDMLKPTLMAAVPAILDRVRDDVWKKCCLEVLHFLVRLKDLSTCLGAPIGQGYGLTETCAGGTCLEYDDTSVGRVGSPLPCSLIKVCKLRKEMFDLSFCLT